MKLEPDALMPFFKGIPLFANLDEATLTLLARASHSKSIAKGSMIFGQNDDADTAYVVCSGTVNIILSTLDGRELVINEMHAGDCFGELALITGAHRSATAVAATAGKLIVIPRQAFLSEMQQQPKLLQGLITTLAERLRASSERESALAFLDVPTRLGRVLLELDRASRKDGFMTISQEELAQRIGATRQTTAKFLGQWRRKGWIVTGRGKIIVLHRSALKRISDEGD